MLPGLILPAVRGRSPSALTWVTGLGLTWPGESREVKPCGWLSPAWLCTALDLAHPGTQHLSAVRVSPCHLFARFR